LRCRLVYPQLPMGWDPGDGVIRVLLDNNAINDLYRSRIGPSVRHALRRLVKIGRYEVLFTISQLTELTGLHSDPQHARLVREIKTLSGERLLQVYPHRIRDELRFGRLSRGRALYSRREAAPLIASLHDRSLAAREEVQATTVKMAFVTREKKARLAVREAPEFTAWPKWKKHWDTNRDDVISNWTADEVDRQLDAAFGVRLDRGRAFDLRRIPTAWYATAFLLARIRLLTDGTVGLRESDVFDREHFGDAAYADLLVTSDRAFVKVAYETGIDRLRVVTFDQWAAEVLAVAR